MDLKNYKKEQDRIFLEYTKKEHLKLLELKDSKSLTNQDKSKLLIYSDILANQVNWEIREQYFQLLKDFLEEKISFSKFYFYFNERYNDSQEISDFLESNCCLLTPDKESLDFSGFLSEILWSCKEITEPYNDKSFNLEEAKIKFLNSMQEIYLKLQKLYAS